jgi:GTP-binding protein
MKTIRSDIRNIAIIAHVDHGKTTLVDAMLRQAKVFRENQQVDVRIMDSNDLERERGITILSKNTAITIPDPESGQMVKINIVDTPGHADFGGEVERVMNMVDGALLLVDAAEGPMAQTRFVLKKALAMGLKVIVVINKMDRKDADPERTLNRVFDLFIDLGATDEQADFPVIYANGIEGKAGFSEDLTENLQPLFQTILDKIDPAEVEVSEPFQMVVSNIFYDDYRGLGIIGRIHRGTITEGMNLARIKVDGTIIPENTRYLYTYSGLNKIETKEASAAIAGMNEIAIGETLTDPNDPEALPAIYVEEPTVKMTFGINTSPLAGREGKWGTSRKLRERLFTELRNNVALRVSETDSTDNFTVSGRGELHLAILIETMRREGYEFQVSRPEVIFLTGVNGEVLEPFEEVFIDTSPDTVGTVVEMLGSRRGRMQGLSDNPDGSVHIHYVIPTRGLLGFRYQFMTATHGMGIINTSFLEYAPYAGSINSRDTNSIVAWENGVTSTYGLKNAEERGVLFVGAGVEVYEGMVVGESMRVTDLAVNVCKKKHLTNMRQSNKDIEVRLNAIRQMSLDEALEYLADDELLEITPINFRIRKKILDTEERGKTQRREREKLAEL